MSRLRAAALLLLAASAAAATRRIERSVPAGPGGTLTLETPAGSVRVEGTDAKTVDLTVDVKGDQKRVDAFTVTVAAKGKGVSVAAEDPLGGSGSLSAEFRLKVPRQSSLTLRTGGGSLRVAGLAGAQDLETSGGSVHVSQVTGGVRAKTAGGSIEVADVEGAVDARSAGGSVDVSVSKGFAGVHAETAGGSVTVSVPKGAAADVDASTGGGKVRCDLPVAVSGEVDPWRLKGPANGGGKPLVARTAGGSVTIRALK